MSHGDPENFNFEDLESELSASPPPPEEPEPAPAVPAYTPTPLASKPAASTPPPPEPRRAGGGVFPVLAGFVLAGVLGGAWYFGMGPGSGAGEGEEEAEVAVVGDGIADQPTSAVSAPEVDALKAEVQAIADRLVAMQANLDAVPRPEPAPDLTPIQDQLATLDGLPGLVQSASEKLAAMEDRITAVEAAARDEVAALREQLEQVRTEPVAEVTEPAPALAEVEEPEPAPVSPEEALNEVATLFSQRRYANAQPILRQLQEEAPDDARVWYFSALVNGYTSSSWEGETVTLVRRGAEREQAGTPAASVIDETFAELPAQTRSWLDFYRRQPR